MKRSIILILILMGVVGGAFGQGAGTAASIYRTTFARLGTPANGSVRYVTDGTPNSVPCTGGGTGAFAQRTNGVWVCGTSSAVPAGTVTSVSGTANQINVATGTTTPVLSLSSTVVLPGTLTLGGAVTGGSNSVNAIKLGSLTTNGPIYTSGGDGTLNSEAALAVARGGTNCTAATITCFNNITGFTAASTSGSTASNLVFSTGPTFSGTITSGGNLLIANTQGVFWGASNTDGIDHSNSSHTFNIYTNNAGRFSIGSTGVVTLNTTNYQSCTALTTNASAVLGCTPSSAKVKENFAPFSNGLNAIRLIQPEYFSFKPGTFSYDNGRRRLGLIAENLQAADPLLVSPLRQDGMDLLQPEPMALHAIEIDAIKRLDARITALEKENARLRRALRRR